MSEIIIREGGKKDISAVSALAYEIWPDAYGKILSEGQLKYMLELIYSEEALQKQIEKGHSFLIAEDNGKPIGFADYNLLNDDVYKLQKIYVLPQYQGKGVGKMLIKHVIKTVKQKNAGALMLNVNRNNKAKHVYEHLGFKVISEEDIDIGEGYFMNDYIMQLEL